MTVTQIAEHRARARHGADGDAQEPAPSAGVEALRTQSHATLTQLVTMLGYPPHWADELERRAFAAGRIWSPGPRQD